MKKLDIEEACQALKYTPNIVEFRTFIDENNPKNFAHLFEPLTSKGKSVTYDNHSASPSQAAQARGQQYLNFYQELAKRLAGKMPIAIAKPKPRYYCQIPTEIGSVHFEWLFWGNPRAKFGVELHFEKSNKERNLALIRELEKYKQDIEKATMETVFFQENWGQKWSRLYIEKKSGEMNEELSNWAVEKMAILFGLVLPKLISLNPNYDFLGNKSVASLSSSFFTFLGTSVKTVFSPSVIT